MAPPIRGQDDEWPPFQTLADLALRHRNLRIRCLDCGHERILGGAGLWWLFHRRQWDGRLAQVARRLKCSHCWRRSQSRGRPRFERTRDDPSGARLPDPEPGEWKRLVARTRC